MYLKELKAGSEVKTCACIFIATLLTVAKKWKHPNVYQLVRG